MIDLKDAATFLRLCETGNVTRTAALCEVSPSTLSRAITRLERELGQQLCERGPKGIVITAHGRKFARFAKDTLLRYEKMRAELGAQSDAISGRVNIYCSVTASYFFIPRLLNELHLTHPRLELILDTGDPAPALQQLSDPKTDFVISALPDPLPAELGTIPLLSFPLLLIAPRPGHELPGFDGRTLTDPAQVPFIFPRSGQLRTETQRWFEQQGISPNIYAECAGHEAIVSLTALGFGLSVVPSMVLELSPFRTSVRILDAEHLGIFNVALCYRKSREQEPRLRAVTEVARRIAPTFEADFAGRRAITVSN